MTVPPPRKIYVPLKVSGISPGDTYQVTRPDNPFVFTAPAVISATTAELAYETSARINADDNEAAARIAGDDAEATARINADNAEASTRATADTNEATLRAAADASERSQRIAGDSVANFMTLNFSGLPTTDPGGGRVWLKAGDLHVGP